MEAVNPVMVECVSRYTNFEHRLWEPPSLINLKDLLFALKGHDARSSTEGTYYSSIAMSIIGRRHLAHSVLWLTVLTMKQQISKYTNTNRYFY